jgi:tryptophan-rich sensory protein
MQTYRRWQTWAGLALSLAVVAAVSAVGSLVTLPKIPGWYATLAKPVFNPPAWVFGPVWTTLYVMMAVAVWRVWLAGDPRRRAALAWYGAQLALNAAWSQVFFGLERPRWALAVILALLATVAATAWRFWSIDRLAGWLLAPYLAWLAFATVLNGAIVAMN